MMSSITRPNLTTKQQETRVLFCTRCRCQMAFRQALSDGTWVCQRCLRCRQNGECPKVTPARS